MRCTQRITLALLAGCLGMLTGCGGDSKYVPVSGVVKIDGQPYGKAVVSFQPMGGEGNPNPGRGSSAFTDENGRFSLKCDGTIDGAVVGKHLVRIMTRGNEVVGQDPNWSSDDGAPPPTKGNVDPIPPEWNSTSKQEFTVPPGGTDQANFNIESRKKKK